MVRLNQRLDPTQTGQDAERLDSGLHKRIIGQDDAIEQIVNIYQTYLTGMNSPYRPVGNFLFLGPTGTGKTRLVEATAECLVGDARAMLKVDCAEFQHSHEIAKLIGSPPGYLGHRETHPLLSQEMLNQYHTEKVKLSFVLFDEIEKASDALWNLLLGILDKATLTLGDNRRVDFSRALIFMTSNLGASEMAAMGRPNLGFASCEAEKRWNAGHVDAATDRKIARAGIEAARRKFTPEFMNRIDKTVVFKALSQVELRKILDLELNRLQQRILSSSTTASFVFELTEEAKDELLREGTDVRYGARHLNRAIDRSLVHPLSNLIATRQVRDGDWVKIDYDPNLHQMTFSKEAEGIPAYAMLQMTESSPYLPPSLASTVAAEIPGSATPGRRVPAGGKERNLAA
ncbi:MAG TPA: AAA family ATPase [Bryobacteraceae bacterium]|nr:AAA family ATPase [Bryobacteraceae bacterium]